MSTDIGSSEHRLDPRTAEAEVIEALRERPCTSAELPGTAAGITYAQREIICRLKSPAKGSRPSGPGAHHGDPTVIYYLWGDDRRAVRRFIEVNRAYVESAMAVDSHSVFATGWDDALYALLIEEWQFAQENGGDR